MRLFTDFRYVEAARAVEGVEFVETKRVARRRRSPSCSRARSASRPTHVSYASLGGRCAAGGAELVPRRGARRGAARGQGRGRAGDDPARRARSRRGLRAARRASRSSAAPSASSPGGSSSSSTSSAPRAARSRRSSPPARTRRTRTHARATARSSAGETVVVDAGALVDGYCSDCTRTFATGALPDELARPTRSASRPSWPRSTPCARASPASTPTRRARRDRGRRPRRAVRPRPRPRRRARGPRGAAPLDRVDRHARGRATSSPSSRASTSPGLGGIRIEDLVVVTRRRARGADELPQGSDHRQLASPAVAETVSTNQFKNGMHIELDGRSGASSSSST